MEERSDRRVERTRQLLRGALVKLILEKGYDEVTVQDIANQANLGRATFYLHYSDKDELLLKMMEEFQEEVSSHMGMLSGDDFLANGQLPSLLAFQHAQEKADFYRAILGEKGVIGVMGRYRQYLVAEVREQIATIMPTDSAALPLDIVANFVAGALHSLLIWWVENDQPHSAEEMARMFQLLVVPGLTALRERESARSES